MSKYHAKPTVYAGVRYDSKREAQYAAQLDLLTRTGHTHKGVSILQWRRQVPFPIRVNGVLICELVLDFEVFYSDGYVEYHEVKGVETPVFKLKLKLFKALYPKETVRIIK